MAAMTYLTRRTTLGATAFGLGGALALTSGGMAGAISAETVPPPPIRTSQTQRFNYEDVVRRAHDLAASPFDGSIEKLPDGLETLDFDGWRDIRFRRQKAIPIGSDGRFQLQLFHLGHLYRRPVIINTLRDGIATPIPYSASLFDYGKTHFDRQLPVNTGFAGFRLHFPINDPRVSDEICSFLGASYFRFLGRGQRYGLSARALAVESGSNREEFPFFREFWIEGADNASDRVIIYALLDGASATGAYRFELEPGRDSVMGVRMTLFPRRAGVKLGIAPITSMYFIGEDDRRCADDFRMELHDSDGLLVCTSSGEWIWRPLRNPVAMQISSFIDPDTRGFGLMQRDRDFSNYQDLDLAYQLRPSYWVEPHENLRDGAVELIELPTQDETNDNIVACFTPHDPVEAGRSYAYSYKITACLDMPRLSPNGRTINTFHTSPRALGSNEISPNGSRRFLIDFSGGELAYLALDPSTIEVVASLSQGVVFRSMLLPNPYIKGVRAILDVQIPPKQTGDIRVFLRSGGRALTETWTFPWSA